jgi:hypothetical protein
MLEESEAHAQDMAEPFLRRRRLLMPPDLIVQSNGDADVAETKEWLDALEGVLQHAVYQHHSTGSAAALSR